MVSESYYIDFSPHIRRDGYFGLFSSIVNVSVVTVIHFYPAPAPVWGESVIVNYRCLFVCLCFSDQQSIQRYLSLIQ